MARPLRIEFSGALYYITSRSYDQQDIFPYEEDQQTFLDYLKWTCDRHQWICHAYCLMPDHYHLLIETVGPTLSKGMKYINGSYTQLYNRQYGGVGPLFHGRYKAIVVEKKTHFLDLARHIVLNPVREGLARSARNYPSSSYQATAGTSKVPGFLYPDEILAGFAKNKTKAKQAYRAFVTAGRKAPSPLDGVVNQIYLGSEQFVADVKNGKSSGQVLDKKAKSKKKGKPKTLPYYKRTSSTRNEAMAAAYRSGHYTLQAVGEYFGVSYATVSRAVKEYDI